jgi:hypothetical protein
VAYLLEEDECRGEAGERRQPEPISEPEKEEQEENLLSY